MYRYFSPKTPVFQRYTWSQCLYYLRTYGCRHMSKSLNSNIDPGGHDMDDMDMWTRSEQSSERSSSQLKAPVSRMMDRNPEDLYRRYISTPDQPENARLLRVAIIGAPNAGKSTLINSLMGWKVNGVSKKVHTTRQNLNTVFTIDNVQIMFVDTPGVMSKAERIKHHCGADLMSEPERSLEEADAVGVIVDAGDKWTRLQLHRELLKVLHLNKDTPSFLILNKVDALDNLSYHKQQQTLLDISRRLCNGIVNGREVGRNRIDKKQKKERSLRNDFDELVPKSSERSKEVTSDTDANAEADSNSSNKGNLKNFFDELEQKYGKIEPKTNEISKNVNSDADANKDCDSKNSNKENLREEICSIVEQSKPNLSDPRHENLNENMTKDEMKVFEKCDIQKFKSENGEIRDINEEANLEASDLSNSDDVIKVEVNAGGLSEVGKQLSSECRDVSESDMLNYEPSQKGLSNETATGLDEDRLMRINLENSYQSEYLERILSEPQLPDYAFVNKFAENKENQQSEEELKIKEAIAAVKGVHGWRGFDRVFPVSALYGTGIDGLKEYLVEVSRPADWIYHSSVITGQHPYETARMCVTQSLLDNIDSYLPYTAKPEITYWDVDDTNCLNISVEIKLRNSYEMGLALGRRGESKVKDIVGSAKQALMDAFQCKVNFKIIFVNRKKRK